MNSTDEHTMMTTHLASALATNRAEELGFDVWDYFVIPPKLNIDDWVNTQKPRVVVGGRGCGKTMLLRYLSHDSAFSPRRSDIDSSSLRHVGIYWRADTQFASILDARSQPDDLWRAAFAHMSSLVLAKEVLRALRSIATSNLRLLDFDELDQLDFSSLSTSSIPTPAEFQHLQEFFQRSLHEFEQWANDVRTVPQPKFLQGPPFLHRLVDIVLTQLPKLNEVQFFVYIDEYENLTILQQRIVNTWIKHSQRPLVFNLAMKRNGFKTRRTLGEESLARTHDYRTVNLEDFDKESEFHLFAAEILLFRLHSGGANLEHFQPQLLRDPRAVSQRASKDYAEQVLRLAKQILPTWTRETLSRDVFSDNTLLRLLNQRIEAGLRRHPDTQVAPDRFTNPDNPLPGAIVVPALLARPRLTPETIADEFQKYSEGQSSNFQTGPQWIHNLFIPCYLDLFSPLVRACPLYSGFDTFCRMARGNLRHFFELCYKTISSLPPTRESAPSSSHQSEAARQVAASLLPEVRSFGRLGNDLHSFLLRLGSLFALSQRRLSQSEPERTHFAIRGGEEMIDQQSKNLLSEAVKWSVLFEEPETKAKSADAPMMTDYVLNPIYAPYFHISYRKGRKLELTAPDFVVLSCGKFDEFKGRLYDRYRHAWRIGKDQARGTQPLLALFDDSPND